MNKRPYWIEQNTQDKLKTLRHEANEYRLLQQAHPQKTFRTSRFNLFQQLMAFWRSRKFQARDSRGGENV